MIDTERSLEDLARLHAEIMRGRADGLHEAAQSAKTRLVERQEALARLRTQVAALKASLNPPPVPAPVRMSVPEKEAVLDSARFTTASLPRTEKNWRSYAPHAAIVACAALMELSGARHAAPAALDLASLIRPAPAVVTVTAPAKTAAKGSPVLAEEDRSQEAMLLVHEWKLPGDEKSLGERLGGEMDLPGGRPAWTVERTTEKGYRVTFQPGDKDVPLAFEADIEARVVWPTPETQDLLAPRFTAALRDAVRQP